MKLPFFLAQKKENPEYFLALLLRDERVTAVIFEELYGKVRVVGENEEYFNEPIETASDETWLDILDKTISKAEEALPANIQTQKTIFGLKENWVLETHIKREYLERIRKMSKGLDLMPIGFIVIAEAIIHLLEKKEGVPVSVILAEIDKKNITISLIRAGKIVHTQNAPIEDSVITTTDKMLHFFTEYGILPSRIILLNGEENDDLSQEFISHAWSKTLPFLHVPQISTLSKRFDAQAVLSGAATQMGFEMLNQKGLENKEILKEKTQSREKNQDILEINEETEGSIQDLGFIKEGDIAQIDLNKANISTDREEEKNIEKETLEIETAPKEVKRKLNANKILTKLSKAILPAKNILTKVHLPPLPNSRKRKGLFILPLILAFFAAAFALYVFTAHARVILFINPNVIQQTEKITLSQEENTDPSRSIVRAQPISVSESGSVSTDSTGTKEIGDRASGDITIVSLLPNSQTFDKGTVIKSSNGLEFTTDESVTIASSSGATDPQTQKVHVVANDIGKEYNLPSGTKFTVASFDASSVQAKNDDPFSGGSKKDITVVSKTDQDRLLVKIPKNLEEKAKEDIAKKVSDNIDIIPGFTSEAITSKYFDKNIGDQASNITLKATVYYQSLSYSKSDLQNISLHLFQNRVQNEAVAAQGITVSLANVKQNKDKTISADLTAKASLLPKINTQELITKIKGKPIKDATEITSKLPQVTDVSIKTYPILPLMPRILPRLGKNIEIVTKINE